VNAAASEGGGMRPPDAWRRLACFLYEGVLLFGVVWAAGLVYSLAIGQRNAMTGQSGMQAVLFLVLGLYFGGRSSGPAAAPTRREPAGGSTAGFARLGIMLTIAGAGAAMLMLTTGCATILRPVQKGVDVVAEKVAGQKGKDLVAGFRDAEGQIYVDANGYIATSNMTKTVAIYAVDEARWITGRVQAVETFVRYQTPIGPAPAAPQAPSAPPPPAAPPTTQPGAGPSEIPLLKGPTTGGVTL